MALQIAFSVPDAQKARVVDAFVTAFNYRDDVEDPENPGEMIPNPETKGEMVKREIVQYVKDVVKAQEKRAADEAQRGGYTDVDVT